MKSKLVLQQLFSFMLVAAFSLHTVNAQNSKSELIGLAASEGAWRNGTIFKINADGTDLRSIFSFDDVGKRNGRLPYGSLIQASNGLLYGMTSRGGKGSDAGTIFKVKADGTGHVVLHDFDYNTGAAPQGSLIQAADGALYGQTYFGGFLGFGTIFKINLDGTGFQIIHHFNGIDGGQLKYSLIQGSDGMLYGTAFSTSGGAVIFRVHTDGQDFEVIRRFNEAPGVPLGSLVQGVNGALYGFLGGLLGDGAIFRMNTDGSDYRILHYLGGEYGFQPASALVQGPDGNLYGMTQRGGAYDKGTIIRIGPDGEYFALLHHFDGNGAHPLGVPIILDNHLWAFTRAGGQYGGGVIFKFNLANEVYTKVADFSEETGTGPESGSLLLVNTPLTVFTPSLAADNITFSDLMSKTMTVSFVPGDGSNHLAVMKAGSPPIFTPSDNTHYSGSVGDKEFVVYNGTESSFELTGLQADTEYYITIFEYNSDGNEIRYRVTGAPLAQQHTRTASDRIFGTTTDGGRRLGGTIFKFNPEQTNSLSVVHLFHHQFGKHAYGNVVEAKDGFLYGTTRGGSAFASNGTIFKVSPDGTQHKVLHNFERAEYGSPYAQSPLIQASNGFLYGTTHAGTIFRIRTDGKDFEVLHTFTNADGTGPNAPLLEASNGFLYGTTVNGGTYGEGTIFQINLDGGGFRTLRHFRGDDEHYTFAGLIQGQDGFLYGVNYGGGTASPGGIFRISLDGSDYRVVHRFESFQKGSPLGGLVQTPDGTLYGTTSGATHSGAHGDGHIFKVQPDGSGYQLVHYFDGENGSKPMGTLTHHNNVLYGFTSFGGSQNAGVVFQYDLASNSYAKLYDLNKATGINPWNSSPIVVNAPDPVTNFVVLPRNDAVNIPLKVNVSANLVAGATTYTIELNPDPSFDETTAIVASGPRVQTFSNLKMGTKYYNRVKTDVTPNWGATHEFTTGDVLTLAYVVSPVHKSENVSYAPTLEANAIEGATTYTVQLSRSNLFDTVAFERTGSSTRFSFAGLQPGTLYYSRVKTNLVDGFGPVRYFTTGDALSLSFVVSPGKNSTGIGTRPVVKANAVPDATTYTIQLSEQEDFGSIAFQLTSSSNWIQFNGLKYNTKYYNRVRTNLTADFGPVKSFTTRTAESISFVKSPADGTTGVQTNSLKVTSNTVPGASQYTIQLSETNTFSTVAFEITSARTSMTFNGLKENTKYYNRVRTNLTSAFGEVRSFSTLATAAARVNAEVNLQHADDDELKLHVYPNPFNDRLTIYVEGVEESAVIDLIDLNGRSVHQSTEETNSTVEISPPAQNGVFFLRVQAGMLVRVQKVVKIK